MDHQPRNARLWRKLAALLTAWLAVACAGVALLARSPVPPPATPSLDVPAIKAGYSQLPLYFEANHGQTDQRVQFIARAPGYTLFLTPDEALLSVTPPDAEGAVLQMQIVGADPHAAAEARDALPGRVSYLLGNDPTQWRMNVPTYARVHYREVYPGVDLTYYGHDRQLEYDFVVAPGADPSQIRLHFGGADRVAVDARGDLQVHTGDEQLTVRRPFVYQEAAGARHAVAGSYALASDGTVAFQVGGYDASRPLVIDPVLLYATWFGAGTSGHQLLAVAVDSQGNAYVAGDTMATTLPTRGCGSPPCQLGPALPISGTGRSAFVAKFNPNLAGDASLVYSTYLGGNDGADFDRIQGIAVDSQGRAHVTGRTRSPNFPVVNAAQPACSGANASECNDAFVAALNPAGNALVYSTFLGGPTPVGSLGDEGHGIAVDQNGLVYITGRANSVFPTTANAYSQTIQGRDAFLAKINPNLSGSASLLYSTLLGGNATGPGCSRTGDDEAFGVAVDGQGVAYLVGTLESCGLPATDSARVVPRRRRDGCQDRHQRRWRGVAHLPHLPGRQQRQRQRLWHRPGARLRRQLRYLPHRRHHLGRLSHRRLRQPPLPPGPGQRQPQRLRRQARPQPDGRGGARLLHPVRRRHLRRERWPRHRRQRPGPGPRHRLLPPLARPHQRRQRRQPGQAQRRRQRARLLHEHRRRFRRPSRHRRRRRRPRLRRRRQRQHANLRLHRQRLPAHADGAGVYFVKLDPVTPGPPTQTPTITPTPTPGLICTPRLPVSVEVARGTGVLTARITANTPPLPNAIVNTISTIQFTSSPGAIMDFPGGDHDVTAPYTLTPNRTQVVFFIRQAVPGQAATANMIVRDGCGTWPTLVGGGPNAFAGGSDATTGDGSGPTSATPSGRSASAATATPTPAGRLANGAAATATPSGRPASAAATPTPAVACTPRPPVELTTAPDGAGGLRVTLTASGANNTLRALRFDPAINAQIEAGGQRGTGNFAVILAPGTRQTTILLSRATAGQATTVPLVVLDACGDWPTVLGGGPAAF